MKLRILGNSIRLRLSVPEVEQIAAEGRVADKVEFAETTFNYVLQLHHSENYQAEFRENALTVSIPHTEGKRWVSTEEVGLEAEIDIAGKRPLHILVEKDFTCLNPRPGEDETQLYPNPKAGQEGLD